MTAPTRVAQAKLALRFVILAGRTLRWRLKKNGPRVVKSVLEYLEEDVPLLWKCTLHQMGLQRARITSRGLRGEGAGSQALLTMEAMSFARLFGLPYVHTPFSIVAHADRSMEEWAATWEPLFNLGAGEPQCEPGAKDVICHSKNMSYLHLCYGWRQRMDELASELSALLPELRRRYYLNKPLRTSKQLSVAVHIRRGDALAHTYLLTNHQKILTTVSTVQSSLEARGLSHRLCIFSQGQPADFAEFSALNAEFFLDTDATWTMQEMIEADILIMAKGSFSLYAGFMCDGIKLIDAVDPGRTDLPRWRVPALSPGDKWVAVQDDGSFDATAFECQLDLLIEGRPSPEE
jgi:hypothetical protein